MPAAPAALTVWFDGGAPLCRRETVLLRRPGRHGAIRFEDISTQTADCPIDRARLLARFHAQEPGQPIVSGAAAFAAMWPAIPLLRPLGELARLPLVLWAFEQAYVGFLKIRLAKAAEIASLQDAARFGRLSAAYPACLPAQICQASVTPAKTVSGRMIPVPPPRPAQTVRGQETFGNRPAY